MTACSQRPPQTTLKGKVLVRGSWLQSERRRRAIYCSTEAAEKALRRLWMKRTDPGSRAARAQDEASAGSPERGCLMSERPETLDELS